jgi:hypothetical protein
MRELEQHELEGADRIGVPSRRGIGDEGFYRAWSVRQTSAFTVDISEVLRLAILICEMQRTVPCHALQFM